MSDQEHKGPGLRKRWIVLLIGSLALNLLVIGAGVGLWINWPRHHYWQADRFLGPAGLGSVARAFDDHDRRLLGKEIASRKHDFGNMRRVGREHLQQLVAVLTQDPFDPDALDAQFARQQEMASSRLRQGQEIVAAKLKTMTREQRLGFAERLERQFQKSGSERR